MYAHTLIHTQDNIMKILIKSLSGPAWKDREAAALALEGFLPSKSWKIVVEPRLNELWHLGKCIKTTHTCAHTHRCPCTYTHTYT